MLEVLAAVAVACCGFGAYVAAVKGRSLWEGMIFGGLLGPFGVVTEACLPNIPPPVESEEQAWDKVERPTTRSVRITTAPRSYY